MLDFEFATQDEICRELGGRLKRQRLAQLLSQQELAARAGISAGTVKNLESKGQTSLDSFVRVVSALGMADHLAELFELRVRSIAEMERNEKALGRRRAPPTRRG